MEFCVIALVIILLFVLFKVIGDFWVDKFEKPNHIDGKKDYSDSHILGMVIFFGIIILLFWAFK